MMIKNHVQGSSQREMKMWLIFFYLFIFLRSLRDRTALILEKVSLLEEKVFFKTRIFKVHYLIHKDQYTAVLCHKDDLWACEEGFRHIRV